MKAIDEEMMHCECEEEETYKYNLPWIGMSVIAGLSTALDKNIFSQMLTESGQLSREKIIIGPTTATTHLTCWMMPMIRRETVMTTVTPKVVMMTEVCKMMTMNGSRIMTSMKYLLLHWMHQGQELWMPSIYPTFGGISMRIQRGLWM